MLTRAKRWIQVLLRPWKDPVINITVVMPSSDPDAFVRGIIAASDPERPRA